MRSAGILTVLLAIRAMASPLLEKRSLPEGVAAHQHNHMDFHAHKERDISARGDAAAEEFTHELDTLYGGSGWHDGGQGGQGGQQNQGQQSQPAPQPQPSAQPPPQQDTQTQTQPQPQPQPAQAKPAVITHVVVVEEVETVDQNGNPIGQPHPMDKQVNQPPPSPQPQAQPQPQPQQQPKPVVHQVQQQQPPSPQPQPQQQQQQQQPKPQPSGQPQQSQTPQKSNSGPISTNGLPTDYVHNLDPTSDIYKGLAKLHHNIHRANHSTGDLVWNDTLAEYAKETAESCIYGHSLAPGGGGYGQNIAAGDAPGNITATLTNVFYNGELELFQAAIGEWGNNNPDMTDFEHWGHATQMLWKDTTSFACYTATCSPPGADPLHCNGNGQSYLKNVRCGNGETEAYNVVCNYYPPGNYPSQYSKVQAPVSKMGTVEMTGSGVHGL